MREVTHFSTVHRRLDTRVLLKECSSIAQDPDFSCNLILADGGPDEIFNGVNISSVPKPKTKIHRIFISQYQIFKKLLKTQSTIYHFHDPELMFTGAALKILGRKVIFDIHEDFPGQLQSKVYLNRPTLLLLSKIYAIFESVMIKFFDYNITVNETIQNRLFKSTKNVEVVYNYPILSEFINAEHDWKSKERIVCYIGGVTRIRGLKSLVQATEIGNFKLLLGGSFDEKAFEDELKSLLEWKNVKYYGQVSRDQMFEIFKESNLGIIPFLPEPNHVNATPNKFFEYLSAGLPIVISNFEKWQNFINKHKVGRTFNPGDSEDLGRAINDLLSDREALKNMSDKSKTLVIEKRNWDNEYTKIKKLYQQISP
ncbi:MAG: glycosyl transferase [Halobacteriovoraceae bacterium]|nr:glycosyl transferase [Halobacteriovoraceae bacterium]|tara:strand:+ start:295 stop:1401 length:1107 start_codon:yes stop_codon:yes gene_type:complete